HMTIVEIAEQEGVKGLNVDGEFHPVGMALMVMLYMLTAEELFPLYNKLQNAGPDYAELEQFCRERHADLKMVQIVVRATADLNELLASTNVTPEAQSALDHLVRMCQDKDGNWGAF